MADPASAITNVFVVMLENRAFDHLLGFSGITGTDPVTNQPTSIIGLNGTESNTYESVTYTVTEPAPATMPVDPGHEFPDVVIQLCGAGNTYPFGGPYSAIDNSGFVADFADSPSPGEGNAPPDDFGEIMACFTTDQLPVLNALANEFVVCDQWFSSMPGPTWPNRFFVHAASSGGLDHSPTTGQILLWETLDGFSFANGAIFDALGSGSWRLYGDGPFTVVAALKGISVSDVHSFSDDFANDVNGSSYPYKYTFIEPDYGDIASGTYEGGNSEHPLSGVNPGEAFVKSIYETLRASPIWDTSLLIITWDEHGGFYDHFAPPPGTPPGDTQPGSKYNEYGFNFAQLGVRVPAIVVSPLIAANLIDHRVYDHTSVLATLEALFGLTNLTARDGAALNLTSLVTLTTARDTPVTLPNPPSIPVAATRPLPDDTTIDAGNLPGFLQVAAKHDVELDPGRRDEVLARLAGIRTRGQARRYLAEVAAKIENRRRGLPL